MFNASRDVSKRLSNLFRVEQQATQCSDLVFSVLLCAESLIQVYDGEEAVFLCLERFYAGVGKQACRGVNTKHCRLCGKRCTGVP